MALISVAEALDHVLAHAVPLDAEEVPLDRGRGRVLALDLKSRRTQPPADVSAMDGYAVRADRCGGGAGAVESHRRSSRRQAIHRQNRAGRSGAHFHRRLRARRRRCRSWSRNRPSATATASKCRKPTVAGRHVRRQGLDFKAGEQLFAKGHRLTARDLALVAGMNHPLVPVFRKPKVALFATGDELVLARHRARSGPDRLFQRLCARLR